MIAPVPLISEKFLTRDERTSTVWLSVRAHLERMLAAKRLENDNPKLTDVETATLRGHIACLTAMIALGKEPPEMTATAGRSKAPIDSGVQYG